MRSQWKTTASYCLLFISAACVSLFSVVATANAQNYGNNYSYGSSYSSFNYGAGNIGNRYSYSYSNQRPSYPVYRPQPASQPIYRPVYQPQPIVYQPQPIQVPVYYQQPVYYPQPVYQPVYYQQPTYQRYPVYSYSQISVSCSPNMTTSYVGYPVTWTAYASGGSGGYQYSWSGTDDSTNINQSGINIYYQSQGSKSMNVTVWSGDGQSATAYCGTINANSAYYSSQYPYYTSSQNIYY